MTNKLRLGPLPKTELAKLAITLPSTVKADLDRYAELYAAAYGEPVDAAALVPHMLAAFMERDRAFRRACQARPPASDDSSSPRSMADATSKANEMPSDASSSR